MEKIFNETRSKTILIMNTDPEEGAGIVLILKAAGAAVRFVPSLSELKSALCSEHSLAVIIDLDSTAVDNRTIRELASSFPATPFLCISQERLHPELKDSIRDHIYACLTKPIDPDELKYWIKCIQEDRPGTTAG